MSKLLPTMEMYFRDVAREKKTFSKKEEMDIGGKVQEGDRGARDEFIKANLPLVVSIAKRYLYHGLELDDLIEEGSLGLIKAVETFDPSRDIRFSTYAFHCISTAVNRALENHSTVIRIPPAMKELVARYRKAEKDLCKDGAHPEFDEVADHVENHHKPLTQATRRSLRRALLVGYAEGDALKGVPVEPNTDLSEEDKKILRDAIQALPERERDIVLSRFGFLNGEIPKFDDLGKRWGCSKQNIRHHLEKSLDELRDVLLPHFPYG